MLISEEKTEGIKPPSRPKQIERAIDGVPGLVEIQYAQRTSYVFTYIEPQTGKRHRHTLKTPHPKNVYEAVVQLDECKKWIANGCSLQDMGLDLNQLFDKHHLPELKCRTVKRKDKRYWRDAQIRYNCHLRAALAGLHPDQLTHIRVQRIIDSLKPIKAGKEALSDASVRQVFIVLKGFCKTLLRAGHLTSDPTRYVQLPRICNQRTRILQDSELAGFFSALDEAPKLFQLLILLLIHTGMRLGEALTSRWSMVSTAERMLWLPTTKTKPRAVPLSDAALEVLDELVSLRTNEFLFPNRSGDGHLLRPWYAYRALVAKAGTLGLRIHDLRRCHGTWSLRQGASIHDVCKVLGHSNVRQTETYIVAHNPRLLAAAQGVGDLINSIVAKNEG